MLLCGKRPLDVKNEAVLRERIRTEGKSERCVWLGSHVPVMLAGSRPQEVGWGLVLSEEKTGLCWFPSNPRRQQAVSEARPSREKLKQLHAQMQTEAVPTPSWTHRYAGASASQLQK